MPAPSSTPAFLPLEEAMPPWRLFLSLQGRINRRCFWLRGMLALFAVSVVILGLLRIAGLPAERAEQWVNLVLAWPFIAVSVKRWHDRDRSGWWVLLTFVPPVALLLVTLVAPASTWLTTIAAFAWLGCALWTLVQTGFLRGTPEPNRFGEAPQPD